VPLHDRYEYLVVEDWSLDDTGVNPPAPVELWRTENLTPCITSTSTRKKRRVTVVGDSLLRGREGPICQADPPHRDVCCHPGARVRDNTMKLPSLAQPSDYYL